MGGPVATETSPPPARRPRCWSCFRSRWSAPGRGRARAWSSCGPPRGRPSWRHTSRCRCSSIRPCTRANGANGPRGGTRRARGARICATSPPRWRSGRGGVGARRGPAARTCRRPTRVTAGSRVPRDDPRAQAEGQAGTASITATRPCVGTMRQSAKPAAAKSSRNSASERCRPPVQTSMLTSFAAAPRLSREWSIFSG